MESCTRCASMPSPVVASELALRSTMSVFHPTSARHAPRLMTVVVFPPLLAPTTANVSAPAARGPCLGPPVLLTALGPLGGDAVAPADCPSRRGGKGSGMPRATRLHHGQARRWSL